MIENVILIDYLPIPRKTPMGQHHPLLWWILLLDLNIPLSKKKLDREGGIIGPSEVTVMRGYLTERDI